VFIRLGRGNRFFWSNETGFNRVGWTTKKEKQVAPKKPVSRNRLQIHNMVQELVTLRGSKSLFSATVPFTETDLNLSGVYLDNDQKLLWFS